MNHLLYASATKIRLATPRPGKPFRAECGECAWTSTYLTEANAEKSADKHAEATEHGNVWAFPNYLEII